MKMQDVRARARAKDLFEIQSNGVEPQPAASESQTDASEAECILVCSFNVSVSAVTSCTECQKSVPLHIHFKVLCKYGINDSRCPL